MCEIIPKFQFKFFLIKQNIYIFMWYSYFKESQDDLGDEDGDDGSETECPSGVWDNERSRTDASNFEESLSANTDGKSVISLSHNTISANRQTQVFIC